MCFFKEGISKSIDLPQPFSGNPHGFDAVFFSGGNTKSGECLIIATERRPNKLTSGILYFWVNASFVERSFQKFTISVDE